MRCTRLLGVFAVVSLLAAPSMASAQEDSPFMNSWFWGAKGGLLVMHTEIGQTNAPMIGAEWLITRSRYALYVGLDQSYFDAVSTVQDAPSTGINRRVDIRDLRRVTAAVYFFPKELITIRPYGGVGFSFNSIVRAASQSNQFSTPESRDTVLARIQEAKTRGSIIGTLGLQWKMGKLAPFLQGTVMPTKGSGGFLLNGETFSYVIEAGMRYNFGSAIEVFR